MLLGILTAAALLLTVSKFITRRLPYRKLDALAMRVHRVSAGGLLVLSAVHLILALKLIHQRPLAMTVLGIVMVLSIAGTVATRLLAKIRRRTWLRLHRALSAVVCLCLAAHIALGVTSLAAYQKAIASTAVTGVDIAGVADGTYEGDYDVGYIYARVSVTVESGEITDIVLLEHRNERGTPAEAILSHIVSEQNVTADAVSGATNSSKVIEMAVENALKKGM